MTDNFEDNEQQETVHPEEGGTGSRRSNLAEAWRTRPLFKLLVVMVVAGAVVALITTLLSSGKKEEMSRLINPPDVHEAPGGKLSPYMLQQTKEAETQRAQEALAKGESALPTPVGQASDINVVEKADPMNELKVETEHLKSQIQQMQLQQTQQAAKEAAEKAQTQTVQQQQQGKPEQFDPTLSQAMQSQMRQLMDSWAPKGIKQSDFSHVADTAGTGGGGQDRRAVQVNSAGQLADANGQLIDTPVNAALAEPARPIVEAGTVNYAQTLTEANSDLPMPVLALIVSGPLNGAKAIGEFQISSGYGDYLVLHFTRANLKGRDYQINAYALDPDTTLGGVVTETDQRYLTRLVLPAAASFLAGVGSAFGQVSSTTTTNGDATIVSQGSVGFDQGIFQGIGAAANTAGSFFQDQANKVKPLVRLAANTPIGLFFVDSVCRWTMCSAQGTNQTDRMQQQNNNNSAQNPYAAYLASLGGGAPGAAGGYGNAGYGNNNNNPAADVPYPNYTNPTPSVNRNYGAPTTGGYGYPSYYGR